MEGLLQRSFCHAFGEFLWFFVTGFIFSKFAGLVHEKRIFQPFVFKMFPGLGGCAVGGHKVSMQSAGVRLGRCGNINPFLLRGWGDEATVRARGSAPVGSAPILTHPA
jgi:hypothetical protein